MRVQFKLNVGSNDAEKYQLDFQRCTAGAECDVPDAVGEALVKRRFATAVETESTPRLAEKPAPLKAIPPTVSTAPKPAEIKSHEPAAKPKGDKKTPE